MLELGIEGNRRSYCPVAASLTPHVSTPCLEGAVETATTPDCPFHALSHDITSGIARRWIQRYVEAPFNLPAQLVHQLLPHRWPGAPPAKSNGLNELETAAARWAAAQQGQHLNRGAAALRWPPRRRGRTSTLCVATTKPVSEGRIGSSAGCRGLHRSAQPLDCQNLTPPSRQSTEARCQHHAPSPERSAHEVRTADPGT